MHTFVSTQELVEHLVALKTTVSAESAKFFELDHGLQCAALLEKSDPADVELQVAGLIHDLILIDTINEFNIRLMVDCAYMRFQAVEAVSSGNKPISAALPALIEGSPVPRMFCGIPGRKAML